MPTPGGEKHMDVSHPGFHAAIFFLAVYHRRPKLTTRGIDQILMMNAYRVIRGLACKQAPGEPELPALIASLS